MTQRGSDAITLCALKKYWRLAAALLILLARAGVGTAAGTDTEKMFARGVYYGNTWAVNAAAAGKDVPAFLDQLFGDLRKTYHFNLMWLNSGGITDQVQTLDIAARHNLKILCSVSAQYSTLLGSAATEAEMQAQAKQVTDAFKGKSALAGYVLWDEPGPLIAPQLDYYRRLLERFDPSHASILVTMPGQTPAYAHRTGFPILCSDIYLFGTPNWPYCPNTPESSRSHYTQTINGLGDLSRKSRKPVWVMPQGCGADFEGSSKSWTDTNGNCVVEPGSIYSLRMPTPAEMRFQIWDSVRAGCRGIVFFLAMPFWPDWRPDKPNLTEEEKRWGERADKLVAANKTTDYPLVKERVNTGEPSHLLHRDGSSTRQIQAIGEAFGELEKLETLLVAWTPAPFPAVFADYPAGVRTFESSDKPGRLFAAVVNHDTATNQSLRLLFAPNVIRVTDLRSGKDVPLSVLADERDQLQGATVLLAAGDGTILDLAFADDTPGIPLFDEDFSRFISPVLLENAERINFPFPFGMGDYWGVRKVRAPLPAGETAAKATGLVCGRQEGAVPCARLTNLQKSVAEQGPLGGSLALADQGLCDVFLAVEGTFPKMESLIVETVNVDGKEVWLRSQDHFHPMRIPAKDVAGKAIVEVRFILGDDALLTGIRCWRIPRKPEAKTPKSI